MWGQFEKELNNILDVIKIPRKNDIKLVQRRILFPNNPGLLTDINKHVKNIYPNYYGGLNITAKSQLSGDLDYTLHVNIDKTEWFRPYGDYIGKTLQNTMLFEHNLSNQLKCTVNAQLDQIENGTLECVLDYYEKESSHSAAISNVGFNNGKASFRTLHTLNNNLSAGGEVTLKSGKGNFREATEINLAARYFDSKRKCIFSGSVGTEGVQICVFKRIDPKLFTSSIIDYELNTQKIIGSVAGQFIHDLGIIKASLDTKGRAGINLSKHLYKDDMDIKVTLGASTDFRNLIKVGVGLDINL